MMGETAATKDAPPVRIPRSMIEVINLAPGVLREYEEAGIVVIVEDAPAPRVRL